MSLPTLLSQHIVRRPQRIALLQHIAEQGSITRAAKSAGLSYKAAWDAIDELNNLAQKPLVERSVGGKGGGGAKLTAEGERVLRLYQRLQVLQAQVLDCAEDASDFNLLGRLMLRTSARNQLHGKVMAIDSHGRNDLIHLELAGGLSLDAQITHDSTLHLELDTGTEVVQARVLENAAAQGNRGNISLGLCPPSQLDDQVSHGEMKVGSQSLVACALRSLATSSTPPERA